MTTEPNGEEVEIERDALELPPLTRPSLPAANGAAANGDGGIYLAQRGDSEVRRVTKNPAQP